MRSVLIALVAVGALSGAAIAQQDEPPPACRANVGAQINYQACLQAASPGSPWERLALINLGTQALNGGNYAQAVGYYDRAQPGDGSLLFSDAQYHANYAMTLDQVGRTADALTQARTALAVLRGVPDASAEVQRTIASHPVDREQVYAFILPVLHKANDPQMPNILREYLALPAQDWVSWANRAAVLLEVGDYAAALEANGRALQLERAHPAVQNNQCYILVKLERAREALPYCEAARAGAPDVAAVRHSVASAYAALGRCADAERELAEARRRDASYHEPLACTPA